MRDESPVPADVLVIEVPKQPSPPANHLEEAATRGLVVVVDSEVLGQLAYAGREYSNLYFGRACVVFVSSIPADNRLLLRLVQSRLLGSLLPLRFCTCREF